MVVFYGSQTGTAEEFASRLCKEARHYGIAAMSADPIEYDMVSESVWRTLYSPSNTPSENITRDKLGISLPY